MYYICNENKDADQLRGYHAADLCLCFDIYNIVLYPGFLYKVSNLRKRGSVCSFYWTINFGWFSSAFLTKSPFTIIQVIFINLPVRSGLLKRIDYQKQICLAHSLSFECFHCS